MPYQYCQVSLPFEFFFLRSVLQVSGSKSTAVLATMLLPFFLYHALVSQKRHFFSVLNLLDVTI